MGPCCYVLHHRCGTQTKRMLACGVDVELDVGLVAAVEEDGLLTTHTHSDKEREKE